MYLQQTLLFSQMRDLNNTLLLYSLRVAFTPLEQVRDNDFSDLKAILRKHVLRLEKNQRHWSNNGVWTKPDSATCAKSALFPSSLGQDSDLKNTEGALSASSLIGIARTVLRTLERSSEISDGSPALQKLREAVAEIATELEPAVKKEPKFEL